MTIMTGYHNRSPFTDHCDILVAADAAHVILEQFIIGSGGR